MFYHKYFKYSGDELESKITRTNTRTMLIVRYYYVNNFFELRES